MAIEDEREAALDFELLFKGGAHPCLVVRTLPAHTIVAVNDRFLAVTGLQRAGILGLGLFDVFPDTYFGRGIAELRASLDRVVRKREQDVMDAQKCDPVRPVAAGVAMAEYWRLINTPVFAPDARISFILQQAEELTDFVRASAWHSGASPQQAETARAPEDRAVTRIELERREAELANLDERIQNLHQARTKFFSNVSRELRTPLTLLLGPLDDILDSPAASLAPDSRTVLELARGNALRLLELVDSLLDSPAVDATRTGPAGEPTDLATFTADLASNFRSACEWAGLNLTVDCPPQPAPVRVDRDMWEKIVLNLIANAFKFTSEGTIEVRLRVQTGTAQLTVRDTGSGFAESELPQLFERFHSVAGARAGVGLAVVRDLVQLHNGSIDVHSELGRGSTFTVRLPLASDMSRRAWERMPQRLT